jgi:hypothetical protein
MKIKKLFIFVIFLANCNSLVELRKQEFTTPVKPEDIKTGCYRQVGVFEAIYKIEREIVYEPETSVIETIPARKETIEEQILERDPYTSCSYNGDIVFCQEYPATFKTVKIEIDYPAYVKTIQTSAVKKIINKPVLVQTERPDIRKVVCPHDATPERIKKLQSRLKRLKIDPGPTDGKLYESTMKAIKNYEIQKGFKEEEQSGADYIMQKTFDILSK